MPEDGKAKRQGPVKRFDARRVKIHRSYGVEEAARVSGSHRNTVRNWLRQGLSAVDAHRPILIRGADLRRFLAARRLRGKSPCTPGQLYCVRCRAPKHPVAQTVQYIAIAAASGNLKGRCPDCGTDIYRRVSLRRLASVTGVLTVLFPQGQQRLTDCDVPSLTCELRPKAETDADPQSRQ